MTGLSRRLLLAIVSLVLLGGGEAVPSARAQNGNTVIIQFPGVPTGTCSFVQIAVNMSTGDFYDCKSGAWFKVISVAGGVTFDLLGSGTNITAAMTLGTGSSLTFSGSGTNNASAINGVTVTGTPGAGQLPISTGPTAAAWSDPIIQGTQAAGSTTIANPLVSGGSDYGGTPAVRAWKVDSAGSGHMTIDNASAIMGNCGATTVNAHQYCGNNTASNGVAPGFVVPLLSDIAASSSANAYTFTGPNLNLGTETFKYINGGRNAAQFSADIGNGINLAWADCSNLCTVYVPETAGGSYSYSTTINYPMTFQGQAELVCALGTVLNYTGTGDGFIANGTGQAYANVHVEGCTFSGTSAGSSGIHNKAYNKGKFDHVSVYGYTNGDGILNEGANTIDFVGSQSHGNKNGQRNVGVVIANVCYAPNAIHWFGGQIGLNNSGSGSNTNWGNFEDASQSAATGTGCTVGPNENNGFVGTVFENNGTNGVGGGNFFVQLCTGCFSLATYDEYLAGSTKTSNFTIGDATYAPQGTQVRNNILLSQGVTNSINIVNGSGASIHGNTEIANVTNFANQGNLARRTEVGCDNTSLGATNYITGTDNGDTLVCIPGNASSFWSTFTNAWGATSRGVGFNQLVGLKQDLEINGRVGDTYIVTFNRASDALRVAAVTDAGQGQFPSIALLGATSGTTTLVPTAIAGSTTATFPANTGTVAELNLAQTWTAAQSFGANQILPTSAGIAILGSTSLPIGTVQIGTAATNNFALTPIATTGARTWNIPDWGANGSATQRQPFIIALTSQYTNSTTGFTNVAGGRTIQWAVAANEETTATCHLYYQAASTGGLNIEFTGPASPTALAYALFDPLTTSSFTDGVATAYSTSLGGVSTAGAVNTEAVVSFSLTNGANAGTINLLAKSSAAVQLQIQTRSYCMIM